MQRNDRPSSTNRPAVRHVTVAEAARLLNLSPEEVGSRVQRGTLDSIKGNGTIYVLLDADQPLSHGYQADGQEKLVGGLRDQVAYLREQLDQEREANRDNRRIIAALSRGVPEPPPPDDPGSPGRWSEVEVVYQREQDDREPVPDLPWWRKVFGG